MKKLYQIILALGLFTSTLAMSASSIEVRKAHCNRRLVPFSGKIFFDSNRGIIGIGGVEVKGGKQCNIMDFYTVLITGNTTINGKSMLAFTPVTAVGRKSTCQSGVTQLQGLGFSSGVYNSDGILTLKNFGRCKEMIFQLQLKR